MNLVSQIVNIIMQFVVRQIFIQYVGAELLGLDSAILAILNIFSLTESGLSTAMIVFLVTPLQEEDYNQVNAILNTFRIMYKRIGIVYIMLAVFAMPLLPYFITGIVINKQVYLYYTLLAVNGALTYFLSYRKVLLFAEQKMYIQKMADFFSYIIFGIIQIIALAVFRNYILYLVVKIAQTFSSNFFIYLFCGKNYPYLVKQECDNNLLKKLGEDMKQLFGGQLAGYVYNSSDSLIISKMINTVQVAYYNNYYLVVNGLKVLLFSIFNAAVPTLKKYMVETGGDKELDYNIFELYTHISFILGAMVIVPAMLLIDDFIILWIGKAFLLKKAIFILLMLDLFICILQNPLGNYLIANEMFEDSKKADSIGAILNLIISIALVFNCKLEGVLIGTVFSRMIQWWLKGRVVLKKYFGVDRYIYKGYWKKNSIRLFGIVVMVVLYSCLDKYITIFSLNIGSWIMRAFLFESLTILGIFLFFIGFREQKVLLNMIKKN